MKLGKLPGGIGIGQPERLATHGITIQFFDEFNGKTKEEIREEVCKAFDLLIGYDRMELVKVETMEEIINSYRDKIKKRHK